MRRGTTTSPHSWRERCVHHGECDQVFRLPFQLYVGAYTGRYGAMARTMLGATPRRLSHAPNSIGETITTGYKLGEFFLVLEQGLGGQLGRPPIGLVPAAWNDFADANVGRDLCRPRTSWPRLWWTRPAWSALPGGLDPGRSGRLRSSPEWTDHGAGCRRPGHCRTLWSPLRRDGLHQGQRRGDDFRCD